MKYQIGDVIQTKDGYIYTVDTLYRDEPDGEDNRGFFEYYCNECGELESLKSPKAYIEDSVEKVHGNIYRDGNEVLKIIIGY